MIRDCQKKKKVCILLTILYSGRYALLVIALLYRTLYISPFVCVCVLWRCQRVWLVSTLKSNNIYATRTIYVSTPGRFFEKRNFFHSSLLPYISRVRRFNPFFFFLCFAMSHIDMSFSCVSLHRRLCRYTSLCLAYNRIQSTYLVLYNWPTGVPRCVVIILFSSGRISLYIYWLFLRISFPTKGTRN